MMQVCLMEQHPTTAANHHDEEPDPHRNSPHCQRNGGVPLGREAFLRATGIKQTDWYGKLWVRWGDALREAGFSPNQMQERLPDEQVLQKLVGLVRELGHFPVHGELRLKERQDPEFPTHGVFARLGSKRQLVQKVVAYCKAHDGYEDVVRLCDSALSALPETRHEQPSDEPPVGFVYLLRSGRYYKIGRTNAAGRRERELAIQLPDKAHTVHVIRTDDPPGIEAYWHKRFEARHKNGEWFDLTAADVKAFKRRKFM